jgi:hypothetical protein
MFSPQQCPPSIGLDARRAEPAMNCLDYDKGRCQAAKRTLLAIERGCNGL